MELPTVVDRLEDAREVIELQENLIEEILKTMGNLYLDSYKANVKLAESELRRERLKAKLRNFDPKSIPSTLNRYSINITCPRCEFRGDVEEDFPCGHDTEISRLKDEIWRWTDATACPTPEEADKFVDGLEADVARLKAELERSERSTSDFQAQANGYVERMRQRDVLFEANRAQSQLLSERSLALSGAEAERDRLRAALEAIRETNPHNDSPPVTLESGLCPECGWRATAEKAKPTETDQLKDALGRLLNHMRRWGSDEEGGGR